MRLQRSRRRETQGGEQPRGAPRLGASRPVGGRRLTAQQRRGTEMFAAIMTAAAVASVLAYVILGYIPRLLVAATVISFLVVVF